MPPDAPTCRRCNAPAAGVVSVAELDASRAQRQVAEVVLCGGCLSEVAVACGYDPPRPGSVREGVRR